MEIGEGLASQGCERIAVVLGCEPVNFITSAAWLAVAMFIGVRVARMRERDAGMLLLPGLVLLIGLLAAARHSAAVQTKQWSESVAIILFIMVYLVMWLRRKLRRGISSVVAALCAFAALQGACMVVFRSGPMKVGGAEPYFASAIFLLSLGRHEQRHLRGRFPYIFSAAVTFVAAMALGAVDQAVCPVFFLGTHWLWHLGCAATCGLLLAGWMDKNLGKAV